MVVRGMTRGLKRDVGVRGMRGYCGPSEAPLRRGGLGRYVEFVSCKGVKENLRWRGEAVRRGMVEAEAGRALRGACAVDPLFWVNGFVWCHEPRKGRAGSGSTSLPMVLWPYQEWALGELLWGMGTFWDSPQQDVLIRKARDMGASYLCILACLWSFLFSASRLSFLWVSRKKELVDSLDDPKSLFWKADFILKRMPSFLLPKGWGPGCRTERHLVNPETGSTIDGEFTTEDVAVGDRRTAILLDEFAYVDFAERVLRDTADVTDCRIFNSTNRGTATPFYRLCQKPDLLKVNLHWWYHPVKGRGAYRDAEGNWTSPWRESEISRRGSKADVAESIDDDPQSSGGPFFAEDLLNRIQAADVRPALLTGELGYDADEGLVTSGFGPAPTGRLRLWCRLGGDGRPAGTGRYFLGCDVNAGSDNSNSCVSVVDGMTGEKVAEFATTRMEPHEFAGYATALARWFDEGMLIWEVNGPGGTFGREVWKRGYRNVYMRRNEESVRRGVSDRPGYFMGRNGGMEVLGHLRAALANGEFVNHSRESVEEMRQYVYGPDGQPVFAGLMRAKDRTGARRNHGDRVGADALACWAARDVRRSGQAEVPDRIPENCLYASLERSRRAEALAAAW